MRAWSLSFFASSKFLGNLVVDFPIGSQGLVIQYRPRGANRDSRIDSHFRCQ
jgi:hypothetical protein